MELRQVRYFLALSETLNFTRAAEMVNVTQPTLTTAIKKLEDEMGGALIHRERGNTHLTQLGQMLLPFLQQVYESSQAARMLADEISRGERTPLSIGLSDSVDKTRVMEPLRQLKRQAEGLELNIEGGRDEALVGNLLEGKLNLAMVDEATVRDEILRFHPIYREDMCVVLPETDPLCAQSSLVSADIVNRHWVGLMGSQVHDAFAEAVRLSDPEWMQQHRASRPIEAQVLALCDMGLVLAGSEEPLLNGLVSRPLTEPLLSRTIGLAQVRGRQLSAAGLSFGRLLRACFHD